MTDTTLSPTPDAAPAAIEDASAPAAAAAPAEGVADAAPTSILGDAVAGGTDGAAAPVVADADAPAGEGDAPAAGAEPVVDAEAAAVEATPYEGLTPPEGFAALDADALVAATPLMRAFGVADDKAQDFINQAAPVLTGMVERAVTAAQEATVTRQAEMATEWAGAVKADPEIGGARYERTVALAAQGLDKFFNGDFRAFLTASGLGNHPEMVRGFAKIGEHFADGEIVTGEPSPVGKAHPLYDQRFLPPEQRQG